MNSVTGWTRAVDIDPSTLNGWDWWDSFPAAEALPPEPMPDVAGATDAPAAEPPASASRRGQRSSLTVMLLMAICAVIVLLNVALLVH